MSTLAGMVSRIADDLNRSDLSSTQIPLAINRAIIAYAKEPFWFKETSATFSTVSGQKAYTTTDTSITDIERINLVEVTQSGSRYKVDKKNIDWIEHRNPNNATGVPSEYAWYGNKFYFCLVPNAVYTITVWYTKTYPVLTGTNTNDWLTYAEDLIEARARWWIAKRILKNGQLADEAKIEEMEALEILRSQNQDSESTETIQPTDF